jgi:hypothetical protein
MAKFIPTPKVRNTSFFVAERATNSMDGPTDKPTDESMDNTTSMAHCIAMVKKQPNANNAALLPNQYQRNVLPLPVADMWCDAASHNDMACSSRALNVPLWHEYSVSCVGVDVPILNRTRRITITVLTCMTISKNTHVVLNPPPPPRPLLLLVLPPPVLN